MKKIIVALVLLAIVVVAAGPFLIGSQIEQITNQLVEKGNLQLANVVKSNSKIQSGTLTIDDYQKGYLDSKANGLLTIAVAADASEVKEYKIPFNTDIKHGPYLGHAGFGLAKIVSRPDLSGLNLPQAINKDTITVEGIVDFSQGLKETVKVAPIKYVNDDGNTINFSGATLKNKSSVKNRSTFMAQLSVKQLMLSSTNESNVLTLKPFEMTINGKGDPDGQAGGYDGHSGIIEASMGEGVSIVLQKMDVSGGYKKARGADFMLGNGQLDLTDLVITNPKTLATPLKLPKLMFKTKLEQTQNEDLNMSLSYQGTLDPSVMRLLRSPVDVKTAELDVKFKAVPLKVVTEYQQLMTDLMAEVDQKKTSQAIEAKFFELIQMLANNSASVDLDLQANTAEGDVLADIDTGFKPGVNFDAAQMMQLLVEPKPSTVLPLLVGRGNVSFSKGITDKAGLTPMIQIMAAEFVTLKDNQFTSKLQIKDGQLLINGSPLPFALE